MRLVTVHFAQLPIWCRWSACRLAALAVLPCRGIPKEFFKPAIVTFDAHL